ncbi:septum site-determining protein MinC [Psychromonas sp. PT13]|uniref:septum site-determining protein MinC n=1 Tax=Psychromonas sp. PT13 TaxID=3439547 RepID=UPI003EB81DA0
MTLKSLNFTLLVVNIDSEDLSVLSEELQRKRMTAPEFFNDAPIVVKLDDHSLNVDFSQLTQVVTEQGFILVGVSGDLSDTQKEHVKAQKIAVLRSSKRQARKEQASVEQGSSSGETEVNSDVKTKVYTGRVRSGQQIYAKEGDLVINGDVGAGAEVIADGSIHIYGALRGKALAGAMGNKTASIFCQLLSPELVSVAGIYKLSDDLSEDFAGKGCIVSLENEQIVLANLSKI